MTNYLSGFLISKLTFCQGYRYSDEPFSLETSKKILYFNHRHLHDDWGIGIGNEPFVVHGCRVRNCYLTADHDFLGPENQVKKYYTFITWAASHFICNSQYAFICVSWVRFQSKKVILNIKNVLFRCLLLVY